MEHGQEAASSLQQPSSIQRKNVARIAADVGGVSDGDADKLMRDLREKQRPPSQPKSDISSKGARAATSLALVASILASAQLAAFLTPAEIIFDASGVRGRGDGSRASGAYIPGYCEHFRSCDAWRIIFGLSCALSLTLNLLTLLSTITIAIGATSWLVAAFGLFAVSLWFMTLALLAICWLVFPAAVAVGSTVFFCVYFVISLCFMLLLWRLAHYMRSDLRVKIKSEALMRNRQSSKKLDGTSEGDGEDTEGTALHQVALETGWVNRHLLAILLGVGQEDVNSEDKRHRRTPLSFAAEHGNLEAVKQFIKAYADVQAADCYGRTPLHWAARYNMVEVVKALLKAGADATLKDHTGATAAMRAQRPGNEEVTTILEEDIMKWRNDALVDAVKRKNLSDMKCLLSAGASPDSVDIRRGSVLSWASTMGFIEGVDELLSSTAKINQDNPAGWTPLHEAAAKGHLKVVQLLIKSGADLNLENKSGKTALSLAVERGQMDIMGTLLLKNAKVVPNDVDAAATLNLSIKAGNIKKLKLGAVQTLLRYKKNEYNCTTNLQAAAMMGCGAAVFKFLLDVPEEKAKLDAADEYGNTTLILAAQGDEEGHVDEDALQELLSAGPNLNQRGDKKRSALHWAAEGGSSRAVELLVAKPNILLDITDVDGRTPLHLAAAEGHLGVAEKLVQASRELMKSKDSVGLTPLHLAAASRHKEVADYFKRMNQELLCLLDSKKRTPSECAKVAGDDDLARSLDPDAAGTVSKSKMRSQGLLCWGRPPGKDPSLLV